MIGARAQPPVRPFHWQTGDPVTQKRPPHQSARPLRGMHAAGVLKRDHLESGTAKTSHEVASLTINDPRAN